MKYLNVRIAPDESLSISRLVLGTDYFGTSVSKDTAFALMDRYVENGGNCIDTARFYADWMPNGHGASETMIGQWLAESGARHKILLSTKGGHPPITDMHFSRIYTKQIEADLDESLRALRTDYIDIYWLHRDSPERTAGDLVENLWPILSSGKVRAIGCSNWRTGRIAQANEYAKTVGRPPFCMSQIQWSLAASTPEAHGDLTKVIMNDEDYKGYVDMQLPLMCYSSQAKGFFVRPTEGPNAINQKSFAWFCTPDNLKRKERVEEYAKERGLTRTAVALGYVLCNRFPAMALIGCRSIEQLEDSMTAGDVDIPLEDADWLYHI